MIRPACRKYQLTTDYWRTIAAPITPAIAVAVNSGYNAAILNLTPTTTATDSPIAYYLVKNIKSGATSKIAANAFNQIHISGLDPLTNYTFSITAVSIDGSASAPSISQVVTTAAVPVVTPALAAPAFSISSSSESRATDSTLSGYTITSTGGAIASYAISPAAPAGLTFSTSTGLLTGSPTAVASATAYIVTATNASGSATATFTLTVTASLAAPAFTLSASSESRTVNTAATGFTISSTGGAIASFAISATPAGMSFSTSTGALSGTPTSVASATAYTITATNASGSATRTFTLTVTAVVYNIGDTGPGGGKIFYYSSAGFNCGTGWTNTGSPTGGLCNYLEVAPNTWSGGSADPTKIWAVSAYQSTDVTGITNEGGANNASAAIGLGYKNSLAIVAQGDGTNVSTTTAAGAARAYSGGSKTDWYLPTTAELNLLCQWARNVTQNVTTPCTGGTLNTGTGASGGFVAYNYWSSSETNATDAWNQSFNNGNQSDDGKDDTAPLVRPVRAF